MINDHKGLSVYYKRRSSYMNAFSDILTILKVFSHQILVRRRKKNGKKILLNSS